MLEEAIDVIRQLWTGETVTHYGEHYVVENARIYTLPQQLPPIMVAAAGSNAAVLAARERGVRTDVFRAGPSPEQLSRIAELVVGGQVRVELTEVLPLAEIRRAHELSESGHTRGKIVLTVPG